LFAALAVCAILAVGCGGAESTRLIDYLDELEFDVPLETAKYVSLGRFDVPVSTTATAAAGSAFVEEVAHGDMVWMRLQFELTAETTLPYEETLKAAAEKHRGALNDAVLTVVRTSTMDELSDPRLAAVNARLTEMVRPILGEEAVRQFVLNDPNSVREREDAEEKAKKAAAAAAHGGGHGDSGHDEAAHGEAGHDESAHGNEGQAEDANGHAEHSDGHHDAAPTGEPAHGASDDVKHGAHAEETHGEEEADGHH
jgi:hypothetical protein